MKKLLIISMLFLLSINAFAAIEKLNFNFSETDEFDGWRLYVKSEWEATSYLPGCHTVQPHLDIIYELDIDWEYEARDKTKYKRIRFNDQESNYSLKVSDHGVCKWTLAPEKVSIIIADEYRRSELNSVLDIFLHQTDSGAININEVKEIRVVDYEEQVGGWGGAVFTSVSSTRLIIGHDDTVLKKCYKRCSLYVDQNDFDDGNVTIPTIIFE